MAHPPAPFQQTPAGQDGYASNALEGRQVGTIGADHLWRYDYDHYPPPGRNIKEDFHHALGSPQAPPSSPPTSQVLQIELANCKQPRDELTGDFATRVLDLATRAFPDYIEQQVQSQAALYFCQGCYDREAGANALNFRPQTVEKAKELVVWRKCAQLYIAQSHERKDVQATTSAPQLTLGEKGVYQVEVPPKSTSRQSCSDRSPGGQQPPKPAQRSPKKQGSSGNQEKCERDEGGHDAGFVSLQGAVESQAAVMETLAAQQAAQASQIEKMAAKVAQIAGLRDTMDAQQGKQAAQIAGLRDAIDSQREAQAAKIENLQGMVEIQAAKIASLQDAKVEILHAQQAAQTARVDKLEKMIDHLTQVISQFRPLGKSPSPPPALSKKLCYRCGQLGHLRKDCPSPRSPRSLAFNVHNALNCSGPDKEATPSPARQMANPGDMLTHASPPTVPLLVRPQFAPRKGPNTPCSNVTPSLLQESTPCPCPRPAPRTSPRIPRPQAVPSPSERVIPAPQPAPRYSLTMPRLGATSSTPEEIAQSPDLHISAMDYEVFVTMDTPALEAAKSASRSHPSSAPDVARRLFEQEPCTSTPVHPHPPVNKPDPPLNSQRSSPWHSLEGPSYDTPLAPAGAHQSPAKVSQTGKDCVIMTSQVVGAVSPCTTPHPVSVVSDMVQQVSRLAPRAGTPAHSVPLLDKKVTPDIPGQVLHSTATPFQAPSPKAAVPDGASPVFGSPPSFPEILQLLDPMKEGRTPPPPVLEAVRDKGTPLNLDLGDTLSPPNLSDMRPSTHPLVAMSSPMAENTTGTLTPTPLGDQPAQVEPKQPPPISCDQPSPLPSAGEKCVPSPDPDTMVTPLLEETKSTSTLRASGTASGMARQLFDKGPCTSVPARPLSPVGKPAALSLDPVTGIPGPRGPYPASGRPPDTPGGSQQVSATPFPGPVTPAPGPRGPYPASGRPPDTPVESQQASANSYPDPVTPAPGPCSPSPASGRPPEYLDTRSTPPSPLPEGGEDPSPSADSGATIVYPLENLQGQVTRFPSPGSRMNMCALGRRDCWNRQI